MRNMFVLLVLFATGLAGAFPVEAAQTQTPSNGVGQVGTCAGGATSAEQPGLQAILDAVPDGVEVVSFAQQKPVGDVPTGTELLLTMDRLTVPAGAATNSRRTVGPTLLLTEDGTIGVFENGRLRDGRQLAQGDSLLVESNRLVALRNDGSEPASVLLLSIEPPQSPTVSVSESSRAYYFPPGQDIDIDRDPDLDAGLVQQQLALIETGPLPPATWSLTLVCLRWTEAETEPLTIGFGAPVLILVLRGEALVDGESLKAGMCLPSPASVDIDVEAGGELPDVLLFGLLPVGDPTAVPKDGFDAAPVSSEQCGGAAP